MNAEYDPNASFKTNLGRWLWNQGVPTAMLFAIGLGIWREWPKIVAKIDDGYRLNAVSHERIADSYRQAVQMQAQTARDILDQHASEERENQRLIVELLKRSDLSSEEFTEAVEATIDKGS